MPMISFMPVRLRKNYLEVIDQTRLPHEMRLLKICSTRELIQAIKCLAIRGAPLIGVAGGYGVLLASWEIKENKNLEKFLRALAEKANAVALARPTAVNLQWAVDRVMSRVYEKPLSVKSARALILEEALKIHNEDRELCLKIGKAGLPLIKKGDSVLTYCNAGALATGGIGTALAPLYLARAKKISFQVYASETRPLLQGARLTAWELKRAGIPFTLICDNTIGTLMRAGRITRVITGADRIAANGDAANKIGTYSAAVLAKRHGIPFYIAAPFSTFDFKLKSGKEIPIEERAGEEVMGFRKNLWAVKGARVFNPSFDVTPHELIAGFITDKGLIRPPFLKNLKKLL